MKPTIIEYIMKYAYDIPDKLAFADNQCALSYSLFYNKVLCGAKYLLDVGVKTGDIVGIKAYQNVEFAVAVFAVQFIGAIICPIEKTANYIRTKEILNQIGSSIYIDLNCYDFDETLFVDIKKLYGYETKINEEYHSNAILSDNMISDIIFTTGTTGKSKGILVSFKANVAIAENVIDSVEMNPNEVELITTPTSHSLALRRIYGAMMRGSSVVLTDNCIVYERFFGLIEKYNVTAITLVPAILNIILEVSEKQLGKYNSQLNYIQIGSAPLMEEQKNFLITLLPDVRLYNTYGATESGCTIILEFSKYVNKKNCIGITTVNTQLLFMDDYGNEIVSKSESTAGYMVFKGDMNMSGYVNEPELTAEVLKDGVIYTNDIGYVDEDGLVYLLGRKGEVINSGGLKISPSEIEEVACNYKGVIDCACVPEADKRVGEIPKLFVVFENNDLDKKDLREYIRNNLEEYKVPKKIQIIKEIPRTFNGKIKRKELQNL